MQAAQQSAISNTFVNHDGQRGDDGRYKAFIADAASVVPKKRVYTGIGSLLVALQALTLARNWALCERPMQCGTDLILRADTADT